MEWMVVTMPEAAVLPRSHFKTTVLNVDAALQSALRCSITLRLA